MKKFVITAFVIVAFSTTTQACPPCRWAERTMNAIAEYMEAVACRAMRTRYGQLVSGTMPPCEHNGKHDK